MKVNGFLIMEPGMDRPLFQHTAPTQYQRKPGSKLFEFALDVPGFDIVDGRLVATAIEIKE